MRESTDRSITLVRNFTRVTPVRMTSVGTTVIRSNRVISRNVDVDWSDLYIFILFCSLSRGQLKNVVYRITHFRIAFRLKKSITYSTLCHDPANGNVRIYGCVCRLGKIFLPTLRSDNVYLTFSDFVRSAGNNGVRRLRSKLVVFDFFSNDRFQICPSPRYKPPVLLCFFIFARVQIKEYEQPLGGRGQASDPTAKIEESVIKVLNGDNDGDRDVQLEMEQQRREQEYNNYKR